MTLYSIQTYGCQMNMADSERLSALLLSQGLDKAENWEMADVLILYSCSVRQAAEDKVYGWGKKFKQAREKAEASSPPREFHPPLVILTGCMAGSARGERQRYSEKLLRHKAAFVDYVLAPDEWEVELPVILASRGFIPGPARVIELEKYLGSGLVKISEGCDNFCTYCVVPYGRGREVSRSREQIISEVKHLIAFGRSHITLLGQNVNSWGIDNPTQKQAIRINSQTSLPFASLLREIHEIEGLEKLSFLTANPFDFTQDLIEAIALPRVDRYLHMAVQSGSDPVLLRMNRRHKVDEYRELIKRIRDRVPDIELGTDIIVGFPSESEEEFQDTLKLVRDIHYNVVFAAMYSPREGTAAAKLYTDDVPKAVKKDRYQRLQKIL